MTDQSSSSQSPTLPPEIAEPIRKLKFQYAEIGVEIEKLDEKIEKLREERSDLSSKQSDVMQQLRMFEEAASDPERIVEIDGVATIVDPRRTLPDIEFKRWEDAPITELGLTDIEGLGRAKRQKLIDEIPTLGALQELIKQASIRCMPLSEVMPKGVGKNTTDVLEERFLNWLDKNRGSYGVEEPEKSEPVVADIEVDGTSRAAKAIKAMNEAMTESSGGDGASDGSGDDGDGGELAVDLSHFGFEIGDDEHDGDDTVNVASEPESPLAEVAPDYVDEIASDEPERDEPERDGPPADPAKRRGRPKGSMDRAPRKRRGESSSIEPDQSEQAEQPDSSADVVTIEPAEPVEPATPPDATEFMFPEDTPEYLLHRYRHLLATREEPREIRDVGIYQSGVEAAHRGWVLDDCNWAPGDNQDDWLRGFISANGKFAADKNELSSID